MPPRGWGQSPLPPSGPTCPRQVREARAEQAEGSALQGHTSGGKFPARAGIAPGHTRVVSFWQVRFFSLSLGKQRSSLFSGGGIRLLGRDCARGAKQTLRGLRGKGQSARLLSVSPRPALSLPSRPLAPQLSWPCLLLPSQNTCHLF